MVTPICLPKRGWVRYGGPVGEVDVEDAAGVGAVLVALMTLAMLGLGVALLLAPLMMVRRLREIREVLLRLTLAVEEAGDDVVGELGEQRPPASVSRGHLPS